MTTFKIELGDKTIVSGYRPIEGRWYAGLTEDGRTGGVGQYINGSFISGDGEVNMGAYSRIRLCSAFEAVALDEAAREEEEPIQKATSTVLRTPEADKQALRLALQWLDTLSKNQQITWAPAQKEACLRALAEARASI